MSRWPHIARYLQRRSSGWVDDDFRRWCDIRERLGPAERAAANEEWADFFEWRSANRAEELPSDRTGRRLVEKWTDSMAYCCRRSAAWARGEDPGEWVPQHVRRPDLDVTT
jgi:hypothetical protein